MVGISSSAGFWGRLGLYSLEILQGRVDKLGPKGQEALARVIAEILRTAQRSKRELMLNLYFQALEGDWSKKKLDALHTANYLHMARTIVEFLRLATLRPEQVRAGMTLEGEEHLRQAISDGKGVIILTAHFGNWELLGARLTQVFSPEKFYVIAQPQRDLRLTQLMDKVRAAQGVQVIPRGKAAREALQALRQGAGVGILLDIDMKGSGVLVDFMGEPASTSTSVAAFALRTGAAVLPVFAYRQSNGTHIGKISPPVTLTRSGEGDQDIYINTAHFSQIIGEQVRAYPEQWIWLPDRWRSAARKGRRNTTRRR
jgi:Kdo2-lipid IVA lauroyltransferase/acyltransferase